MNKYLRDLLILTAGLLALYAVLFLATPHLLSAAVPVIILFFTLVTWINHKVLNSMTRQKSVKFINAYLISTVLRLFLFLAIMIGYAFAQRHDAIRFIIAFFAVYIAFAVFEVIHLMQLIRQNQVYK